MSEKSSDSDGELGNAAEQIKSSAKLEEDVKFSKQLTVSNAKKGNNKDASYSENISASEIY